MEENLVTVNGVNITPYINRKTYKMNSKDIYETWDNANFVETRIFVRTRISGQFEVAVYGRNSIDYDAFMEIWDNAVEDGIVTLGVYVQNTGKFEAIEAYYDRTAKAHERLMTNGYLDRITFKIEER